MALRINGERGMVNDNGNGPIESRLAELNDQVLDVQNYMDNLDDFDLHSDNLESCRAWAVMTVAYVKSVLALIEIIKNDEQEIRRQLQESIDHSQELLDRFKRAP